MKSKREMEVDLMTQLKDIGRNAMANFTSAVKNDLVCASVGVRIYISRRSVRVCVRVRVSKFIGTRVSMHVRRFKHHHTVLRYVFL